MKKGKVVKFKITAYPYERTGVVVRHESGGVNIVKVQYNKKFMLFRKKDKELTEEKNNEKNKKTLDNCDKKGDNQPVFKNNKGERK